MRITALILLLTVSGWADGAFGTWTMNPAQSTLGGDDPRPKSITIRIESHAKSEVFTSDRIEADGRPTTFSTHSVSGPQEAGFPGPRVFGNPIVAPGGQPDRGDPAHVRQRRVAVRPAIVRESQMN
jgi:hypothetical protein